MSQRLKRVMLVLAILAGATYSTACSTLVGREPQAPDEETASLTPVSETYMDLINLPAPRGKIPASIYGFRDQTGQYRSAPASNFSTAVTQGAASMLIKALLDSGWFIPVEREGLQDLLTERKIIRAAANQDNRETNLPPLIAANVLLEGGIVAYESNVQTGGSGAKYFGIGAFDLYRMDQVTVGLRAVDIRTGQILKSVFTTKTVYSYQVDVGVYRFIKFKRLLEAEAGYTRNEPAQLCVKDAIEAAVIHLIVQGVEDRIWHLANPRDMDNPVVRGYLREYRDQLTEYAP